MLFLESDFCSNFTQYSQFFYLLPNEYDAHYGDVNLIAQENNPDLSKQLEDSIVKSYGHIFQFDYEYDLAANTENMESQQPQPQSQQQQFINNHNRM